MMQLTCSFCGRSKGEVGLLISGIDAHICEDCIENDRNSKKLLKKLFENLDKSIESLLMSIANVEVTK